LNLTDASLPSQMLQQAGPSATHAEGINLPRYQQGC